MDAVAAIELLTRGQLAVLYNGTRYCVVENNKVTGRFKDQFEVVLHLYHKHCRTYKQATKLVVDATY